MRQAEARKGSSGAEPRGFVPLRLSGARHRALPCANELNTCPAYAHQYVSCRWSMRATAIRALVDKPLPQLVPHAGRPMTGHGPSAYLTAALAAVCRASCAALPGEEYRYSAIPPRAFSAAAGGISLCSMARQDIRFAWGPGCRSSSPPRTVSSHLSAEEAARCRCPTPAWWAPPPALPWTRPATTASWWHHRHGRHGAAKYYAAVIRDAAHVQICARLFIASAAAGRERLVSRRQPRTKPTITVLYLHELKDAGVDTLILWLHPHYLLPKR